MMYIRHEIILRKTYDIPWQPVYTYHHGLNWLGAVLKVSFKGICLVPWQNYLTAFEEVHPIKEIIFGEVKYFYGDI